MTPNSVAGAYSAISRLAQPVHANPPEARENAGSGFAGLLTQAVASVAEAGKAAEQGAVALAAGRADVVDVVTAVAESEVALETMVAIRDRVISAYEEIMRMPI